MYDFWFTLGYAATDLGLVKKVMPDPGKFKFTFVDRLVIEVGKGIITTRHGPSTGLLDKTVTTAMRQDIVGYFVANKVVAPPIGIYTAGRFCQLVSIPQFQSKVDPTTFADIMNSANSAYLAATKPGPSKNPAFPAVLGMCLMDSLVSEAIRKHGDTPGNDELTEILGEFGVIIGSSDWTILKTFVNDQGFKDAVGLLMGGTGDQDPWADAGTTLEQMMFWPGKSEYAIP